VEHLGLLDVTGEISGATGFIEVDLKSETPVSAKISIESRTIDTGNQSRDESIRSDEFLDTDRFPSIEFTSATFAPPVDAAQEGVATGELTIAGQTRTIQFPYTLSQQVSNSGIRSIIIEATFIFSREEFDLEFGRIMDALVGDEISVSVRLAGTFLD